MDRLNSTKPLRIQNRGFIPVDSDPIDSDILSNSLKPNGTSSSVGEAASDGNAKTMSQTVVPYRMNYLPGIGGGTEKVFAIKAKSLYEFGYKPYDIEDWYGIQQHPKESLCNLLKSMVEQFLMTNIKVRIDSLDFNCHLMVLQCYSEVFKDVTDEVVVEMPPGQIEASEFVLLYEWMLAEKPVLPRENFLKLYKAASFLRVTELLNLCWCCMDDSSRFNEDTALLFYMDARAHEQYHLGELLLIRVCKFFLTFISTTEFLDMKSEEVCSFLKMSSIGVNSEIEVFLCAIRWLNHKWPLRESDAAIVMKSVRFGLMPPWYLLSLRLDNIECLEVDRIIRVPAIKEMVTDGISCTTSIRYYRDKPIEYEHYLARFHIKPPSERLWLFDINCSYHHSHNCLSVYPVNYVAFLQYLQFLQDAEKDYWQTLQYTSSLEASNGCCPRCGKSISN